MSAFSRAQSNYDRAEPPEYEAEDEGLAEALDGGTCICGQVLDVDALRCDECGRCVSCGHGLPEGEECGPCAEFMAREKRQAVTR